MLSEQLLSASSPAAHKGHDGNQDAAVSTSSSPRTIQPPLADEQPFTPGGDQPEPEAEGSPLQPRADEQPFTPGGDHPEPEAEGSPLQPRENDAEQHLEGKLTKWDLPILVSFLWQLVITMICFPSIAIVFTGLAWPGMLQEDKWVGSAGEWGFAITALVLCIISVIFEAWNTTPHVYLSLKAENLKRADSTNAPPQFAPMQFEKGDQVMVRALSSRHNDQTGKVIGSDGAEDPSLRRYEVQMNAKSINEWALVLLMWNGLTWIAQGTVAYGLALRWWTKTKHWTQNTCHSHADLLTENITALVSLAREEGVQEQTILHATKNEYAAGCPGHSVPFATKFSMNDCHSAQLREVISDQCVVTSEYLYPAMAFVFLAVMRAHEDSVYPQTHNKFLEQSNVVTYGMRRLIAAISNQIEFYDRKWNESDEDYAGKIETISPTGGGHQYIRVHISAGHCFRVDSKVQIELRGEKGKGTDGPLPFSHHNFGPFRVVKVGLPTNGKYVSFDAMRVHYQDNKYIVDGNGKGIAGDIENFTGGSYRDANLHWTISAMDSSSQTETRWSRPRRRFLYGLFAGAVFGAVVPGLLCVLVFGIGLTRSVTISVLVCGLLVGCISAFGCSESVQCCCCTRFHKATRMYRIELEQEIRDRGAHLSFVGKYRSIHGRRFRELEKTYIEDFEYEKFGSRIGAGLKTELKYTEEQQAELKKKHAATQNDKHGPQEYLKKKYTPTQIKQLKEEGKRNQDDFVKYISAIAAVENFQKQNKETDQDDTMTSNWPAKQKSASEGYRGTYLLSTSGTGTSADSFEGSLLEEESLVAQPIIMAILQLRMQVMNRVVAAGGAWQDMRGSASMTSRTLTKQLSAALSDNELQRLDSDASQSSISSVIDDGTGNQLIKASAVVRMIILLSKTDQIVQHKWWWYFVCVLSMAHAAVPLLISRVYDPYSHGYLEQEWHNVLNSTVVIVFLIVAIVFVAAGAWIKTGYVSSTSGAIGLTAALLAVVSDLIISDERLAFEERLKSVPYLCVADQTALDEQRCDAVLGVHYQNYSCTKVLDHCISTSSTKYFDYAFNISYSESEAEAVWHKATMENVGRILGFLINYTLTFSITIRLAKCYEDYYEKYRRMLYLLHMCPWSTLKMDKRIPTYGLLPTFDLDSVVNIVAWNKMRIFLQTYEIKESRKRQMSVVYMLGAWILISIFQTFKFLDPARSSGDTTAWFVFSNTFQLAIGLTLILRLGTKTNELQGLGFEHMLRVKQAELASKSTFFLVEHEMTSPAVTRLRRANSAGDREFHHAIGKVRDRVDSSPLRQSKRAVLKLSVASKDQDWSTDKRAQWLHENSGSFEHRQKKFKAEARNSGLHGGPEWAAFQERCNNRLHRLLESVIEIVKTEHGPGDRTHWGAEDRRSKLTFIYLGQNTLVTFWTSILSVVLPAAYHFVNGLFVKQEFEYWKDNVIPMDKNQSTGTSTNNSKCTAGDLLVHILSEVGSADATTTNFECPGVQLRSGIGDGVN